MAITVETGAGLAAANSYVSISEARAFAMSRGIEFPSDDAQVETFLIRAMDYLEAQRSKYQGKKTWPVGTPEHPEAQALQWPRTGVILDCNYHLPDNVIPTELKNAQMLAAMEVQAGMELMPSSDGRIVKREKVDVIETEYMTGKDLAAGSPVYPSFPAIDALLEPLFFACGGGGFALRTVRV